MHKGKNLKNRIDRLIELGRKDAKEVFSSENFEQLFQKISEIIGEEVKPRILMAGKTGSGKSSVLNALLDKNVFEIGVIPTTKTNVEEVWQTQHGDIVVIDVPGFSEAEAATLDGKDYTENINQLARLEAHLAVMVIKCDDRALEKEVDFLQSWYSNPLLRKLPLVVVVNQIDKMKPVRDWEPQNLNLRCPVDCKSKNIRKFLDYLLRLKSFSGFVFEENLIAFSAGESFDDTQKYGIDNLRNAIYSLLPESAKTIFARAAELKAREGERIINYYAGASGTAVAANFVPGSDFFILAPLQIAMIMHLGRLHAISITHKVAKGIVNSLISTLAGRYTYQLLISMIPGIKNFVGPALAISITYAMGQIVNEQFKNNSLDFSSEKIKKQAANISEEAFEKGAKNFEA